MKRKIINLIAVFATFLTAFCGDAAAQTNRERAGRTVECAANSPLNGVFRIDTAASDKLYSVIEGAASNVPYGDQQMFFNDLAVRLTPPDLLAIECRGSRVSLGSSRAARVEFVADGVTRSGGRADGSVVRSRIAFERGGLIFNSGGRGQDTLSFTFTPLENGKRMRVTRRITAQELIEPVVIQTVYNKIGEVARWDIFDSDKAQTARRAVDENRSSAAASAMNSAAARSSNSTKIESGQANDLRDALDRWVAATNLNDIARQMSFYMPQLKAFYLARNTSRTAVRQEKIRAFAGARSIDIRAAEPEIIFQDGGRTAIMRFRKKYSITGARTKSGEVVQELRWQQNGGDWKIFSERDIRVIK